MPAGTHGPSHQVSRRATVDSPRKLREPLRERIHRTHARVANVDGPPSASRRIVRRTRLALNALIFAVCLSPLACSGESDRDGADRGLVSDHHDGQEPRDEATTGSVSSALAANATVGQAVASECATSAVKGLSVQLVEEIQCLRPNTFMRIDKLPGLTLGSSVMPYMQTKAAQALIAAQKARGQAMSINSAMRTLPQQYLLYRWYQTGRCGIGLAASPGTSNHEGAIAVDINDNAGWRTAMQGKSFRWLGASDPVHYDFVGGGTVNLRGLSVQAFQRLWNRNNPNDKIAEDGDYGGATASRLAQAPVGGFAKGADCTLPKPDAGADASTDPPLTSPDDVTPVPDANEGDDTGSAPASGTPPTTQSGLGPTGASLPSAESGSCNVAMAGGAGNGTGTGSGAACLGLAAALVMAARRRRQDP